jgi:hypothetical protein
MKFTAAAVVPFLVASQVAAICPGFNYGIGNVQRLGNGINRCPCNSSYSNFNLNL